MKKYFLFLFTIITIAACEKHDRLPTYTPPVAKNFTVTSLKHTMDTVNVGDTIYLIATGTASDSSQFIYTYITVTSSAGGLNPSYSYGTAAAPIKLSKNYMSSSAGLYTWTATIMLPGATFVPSGTKLTIAANFIYQLSLSSEQGTLSAADAGVTSKTVFVQ